MRSKKVLLVDFRSTVSDFDDELKALFDESNFSVRMLNTDYNRSNMFVSRVICVIQIFVRVMCYVINYQKHGFIIFCWPPEYKFELFLARVLLWFGDNEAYVFIHNYEHHDTKLSYFERPGVKLLESGIAVVVLSNNVYANLSDKVSNPIIECRHPILTRYGWDSDRTSSFAHRQEPMVLGSIGGIRPYKNIELLINYVGLYRNITGKDLRLRILGEDKSRVLSTYEGNWLEHENKRFTELDLRNFTTKIDVAVFGYKNISQSGAVYLPLAFGTPVCCNRVGDFAELLEIFGDAALEFDLATFNAFATAMDSLFRRRDELKHLGAQQSLRTYDKRNRKQAFIALLENMNA